MRVLRTSYEAGDKLEKGVLAEFQGRPSAKTLRESYNFYVKTLKEMDVLATKLDELSRFGASKVRTPEFDMALQNILKNHPPIERVSATQSRFSNIARGESPVENKSRIGDNLDEVINNIRTDLTILRKQQAATIEAFRETLPIAEKGGFASMVLSGRAKFPELIMQSEEMLTTFVRFYTQACLTTISATMHVYPKGLEWLPTPRKK